MFIKALLREVGPSRWWSGKSNTFLNRGLVAIWEKCEVPEHALEIGAGINVGDMVQPNILEPLVLAKKINITFVFGILMHFIQWLNLCSNSRTKNLMEPLNSNLIGFLSVRKLIRKHCTVRSVKSNVRRVLPYLLF